MNLQQCNEAIAKLEQRYDALTQEFNEVVSRLIGIEQMWKQQGDKPPAPSDDK